MKLIKNITNYIVRKFEENNFEYIEEDYKEIIFEYIGNDVNYSYDEDDFETYSEYDEYLYSQDEIIKQHLKEMKERFKNKNINIEFSHMTLNFDRGVIPVIEVGVK